MGRPPKGMSKKERDALDALIGGTADEYQRRLGMSVLRGLNAPEFLGAYMPRRGRPSNVDRKRRVQNHYAILTNPRYRESPGVCRVALPVAEVIMRIAQSEKITITHVRELLCDELAEVAARADALRRAEDEERLLVAEQLAQRNQRICVAYEGTIQNVFNVRSVRSMGGFGDAFEDVHRKVVAQIAAEHGLDDTELDGLVKINKAKIKLTLAKETRADLLCRT